MDIIHILLCGLLDRVRGDKFKFISRVVEKLLYGSVFGLLLSIHDPRALLGFAVLFSIGSSFGWGSPLSAALTGSAMDPKEKEWWQFGLLEYNAWAATIFRGILWGLPCLLLINSISQVIFVPFIYGLSMPLAILAAKYAPYKLIISICDKRWQFQEIVRGILSGILATICVGYL